jgi:hypothetical protein
MQRLAMSILWPTFLMSGVLEALIFVVVNPEDLRWFNGPMLGWSTNAVYSMTFLIIWTVMIAAGVLTALLLRSADDINQLGH